jgi:hypothetical protein
MATETLVCKGTPKTHKWKRESTRGRKPQFCPKHKPEIVPGAGEAKTLHCVLGDHDWIRQPTRGRVPVNCPDHKPLIVIPPTVTMDSAGDKIDKLHCEVGNHAWERKSTRGRKPANCPEHSPVGPRSVPVAVVEGSESGDAPKKRGKTPEEQAAADLKKSTEKVNRLEQSLKARGTHLSQQTPYKLYKRVDGPTKRGTTTWDYVTEHSPLNRERFLNEHEAEFLAKRYRYERDGTVVTS